MTNTIEESTQALQQLRNECGALGFENRKLAACNDYLQKKIMELMRKEAAIRHQAFHDSLTGLPNRNLLQDRFQQAKCLAIRHDHSLALLMLDLDRFKAINDTLGHATGDDLLKAVAQRLNDVMRAMDTACRYGGDEFLILLSEIEDQIDTDFTAERICGILNAPYSIDGKEIHITASIGAAVYPADGKTYDELFRQADKAMYRSRKRRKSLLTGLPRASQLRVVTSLSPARNHSDKHIESDGRYPV